MGSEPLDDEEIRRRFERATHTRPGVRITVNIRTSMGETGWVPVPGDRFAAIVDAASRPAVSTAPRTGVGQRVKSMPHGAALGVIESVNMAARRFVIAWDDGTAATYRFGDLGVTWAYAPDRTTSTNDKEET